MKYCNIFSKHRQKGFTLVGTLISAAMMGGLALLLADLTKKQHIVQKTTETQLEITSLFNLIIRTLHEGEACNETLIVGRPIADGRNIDFIKNEDGETVLNTTDKYGNGLVRIDSMALKNTRITVSSGEVNLEVVFLKLSKAIKGYKKDVRNFPLSVEVDSSSNLISCQHTVENLLQIVSDVMNNQIVPAMDTTVDELREELCIALGADYDATGKTCSLSSSPPPPPSIPPPVVASFNVSAEAPFFPPYPSHSDLNDCDRPTYICRGPDSNYQEGDSSQICGHRDGMISYYGIIERYTTSACYFDPTAVGSGEYATVTGYHPTDCGPAKEAVLAVIDPTSLSTTPSSIEPTGHYGGRIFCNNCRRINGFFTISCRFLKRGVTFKCNYSCNPPSDLPLI